MNACIFILTHNRAERQYTANLLKELGTKIPYYLVVDDQDPELDLYKKNYDNLLIFNKEDAIKELNVDLCDNFKNYLCTVISRNICFKFAKDLGYDYFVELDDDYHCISYRHEKNKKLLQPTIKDSFDEIMEAYITFLENSGIDGVAFAQMGDYIGGVQSKMHRRKYIQKIMNWIFLKTDSDVRFRGTMNDDVSTFTLLGSQGYIFITPTYISVKPDITQATSGGLTDLYLNQGTYVKSFYSVMNMPSAVKISVMGSTTKQRHGNYRIHHRVFWGNCYPKIIDEKYKK